MPQHVSHTWLSILDGESRVIRRIKIVLHALKRLPQSVFGLLSFAPVCMQDFVACTCTHARIHTHAHAQIQFAVEVSGGHYSLAIDGSWLSLDSVTTFAPLPPKLFHHMGNGKEVLRAASCIAQTDVRIFVGLPSFCELRWWQVQQQAFADVPGVGSPVNICLLLSINKNVSLHCLLA
jgi:hypothetical protein